MAAKKERKPMGLSTKIFVALIVGALLGVGIHYFMPAGYLRDTIIIEGVFYVVGQGLFHLCSAH